jgi:multiple antibiotic resistance protein
MVLSGQSHGVVDYGILVVAIVVVMILTYFILSGANSLAKRLGATGTRIIQRIMGLILLVIATQFVINGVTPVLEGILIRVEH